jgi:hypothetical protein
VSGATSAATATTAENLHPRFIEPSFLWLVVVHPIALGGQLRHALRDLGPFFRAERKQVAFSSPVPAVCGLRERTRSPRGDRPPHDGRALDGMGEMRL